MLVRQHVLEFSPEFAIEPEPREGALHAVDGRYLHAGRAISAHLVRLARQKKLSDTLREVDGAAIPLPVHSHFIASGLRA
jgi:hypothetical protein